MKNFFNRRIIYTLISLAFLLIGGLVFQQRLAGTVYAEDTLECNKTAFTPEELGVGDCRICNRLHQFVLKAPIKDGSGDATCAKSHTCQKNEDCPANTGDPLNINAADSGWCFGFKDGPRCVRLQYIGPGTGSPPKCGPNDTPRPPSCDGGSGGGDGSGPCNLANQTPGMTEDCATCLAKIEGETIKSIKDKSGQTGCSNLKVLNFWCNGGVSPAGRLARVVASWVVELRPNVMNKHQVRVVVIQVVK
ncbi:hypothetical protein HYU93_00545 [Candidatus Daviesbacteria bacterium]|nr:hypothetical protein [Candidatus Daviesbacteria bacterium]